MRILCHHQTCVQVLTIVIFLANDFLAHMSAISWLPESLFTEDYNLPLPDRHFNVTIGNSSGHTQILVYAFNLTNGTLHTGATRDNNKNGRSCTAKPHGIDVTCRVDMTGWCASYDGKIYNGTHPDGDEAEAFKVNVTIQKYTSPRNPADITVNLRTGNPPTGLTVSTTWMTEFIIVVTEKPPFANLSIFHGNTTLAKMVKDGFEDKLWDTTKPDIKEVLKKKYPNSVKGKINIQH
ncbi:uncharacterized protein LOC119399343 [Rhipicephalus sanguineus]|uniref:uncharacterized protein LOC119399343 n=1 Tax=Rhipicephalus sanguineus TaxID=34632 RepID=UPI0018948F3B|nr:uncharacterized protein LOC119399343 [Rhipicephalus sanguineus]